MTQEVIPRSKIEDEILDEKIEKAKLMLYLELARKKRNIKRHWMEINSVMQNHFLQTLPYRSMLNHVSDLTAKRREALSVPDQTVHLYDQQLEGSPKITRPSGKIHKEYTSNFALPNLETPGSDHNYDNSDDEFPSLPSEVSS